MRSSTRFKRILKNKENRRQKQYLNRTIESYRPTLAEEQMAAITTNQPDPLEGEYSLEDNRNDEEFLQWCKDNDIDLDDWRMIYQYAAFAYEKQMGRKLYETENEFWNQVEPVPSVGIEQEIKEPEHREWVYI